MREIADNTIQTGRSNTHKNRTSVNERLSRS